MSAMKGDTHWQVTEGGVDVLNQKTVDAETETEKESIRNICVTAVQIPRFGSRCQVLSKTQIQGGSITKSEQLFHAAKITSTVPLDNSTVFNLTTNIDNQEVKLQLTAIRSQDKNCVVM